MHACLNSLYVTSLVIHDLNSIFIRMKLLGDK